jgi:hypothetical protein
VIEEPPATLYVKLSDEDWMKLLDGSTKRAGLIKCCDNVAGLRDVIFQVAREGGACNPFLRERFIEALGWVLHGGTHDVAFPALIKFTQQLNLDRPPAHKPMEGLE